MRCARCKKVKGKTQFSRDATRPSGFFPWCMTCQNDHYKEHRFQDETAPPNGHTCPVDDRIVRGHANRRFCSARCKEKASSLRQNFSLSIEDYRRLVDDANGRCPICQRRPTEWHVDHDHGTGLVMGVVCSACNTGGLAMTYHDANYIRRLLVFVESSPASRLGIVAKAKKTRPSGLHRVWKRRAPRARR